MTKPLIVYHGGCPDGFTAAWAMHRRLGNVELHYGRYGDPPPVVAGRNVYIVDFSYPRETLLKMHEEADTLRVLDHHKTAQADLEGLDFCVFDMERSGAGLAWDCMAGTGERPWLINYVEDRDLWRFALPRSRAVAAYVMAQPHEIAVWNRLNEMDIDEVANLGEAIQTKIDSYIAAWRKQAALLDCFGYIQVPVVNAPYIMISDLLDALCTESPLALGWFQRGDGKYQFSLRSRGDVDVSEIAKRFGGGGHKNAAGFVVGERPTELRY